MTIERFFMACASRPDPLLIAHDDSQTVVTSLAQPSANVGAGSGGSKTSYVSAAGKFGSKYVTTVCDAAAAYDLTFALPGATDIRPRIGTGPFTLSGWLKQGSGYSSTGDWYPMRFHSVAGGTVQYGFRTNENNVYVTIAGTQTNMGLLFDTATVWKHIAIVRSGGVSSAWFNGTRYVNQVADTYDWAGIVQMSVGSSSGTAYGNVDQDDMVLRAEAVWSPASATITVPTAPLGLGAA